MAESIERAIDMQQIMVNVPDEIAARLASCPDELPQILMLGLREVDANPTSGFSGLSEVLEFLVKLPAPQEILALRLSLEAQAEVDLFTREESIGRAKCG